MTDHLRPPAAVLRFSVPADRSSRVSALLVATAEGDERAFAELYRATRPRILDLVRLTVVDPAQSEEVAQEVYLEAWLKAGSFDPSRGSGTGWLRSIARRRAIDRVRSSQSDRDRDERVGQRDVDVAYDSVGEHVETRVDGERARGLLVVLTPPQRQVIELVIDAGLTPREASDALELPLTTVKSRLYDGVARLREHARAQAEALAG